MGVPDQALLTIDDSVPELVNISDDEEASPELVCSTAAPFHPNPHPPHSDTPLTQTPTHPLLRFLQEAPAADPQQQVLGAAAAAAPATPPVLVAAADDNGEAPPIVPALVRPSRPARQAVGCY